MWNNKFKEEYKMVKKLIRITASSLTSGMVLMGFIKMGLKLNILETTQQSNVCIILGIMLISILNLQIFTEKQQRAI